MSQHTARHDPHAEPGDEDSAGPQARQPQRGQAMRPRPADQHAGQPAGDRGISPDEPDDGEVELIGDDDLGAADLGPAAPNATDPDAGSGRPRKITRQGGRGTGRRQPGQLH
jgi:hypothetical protein